MRRESREADAARSLDRYSSAFLKPGPNFCMGRARTEETTCVSASSTPNTTGWVRKTAKPRCAIPSMEAKDTGGELVCGDSSREPSCERIAATNSDHERRAATRLPAQSESSYKPCNYSIALYASRSRRLGCAVRFESEAKRRCVGLRCRSAGAVARLATTGVAATRKVEARSTYRDGVGEGVASSVVWRTAVVELISW